MTYLALARPLTERHHAFDVAAGLYLLRYVSAPSARGRPCITVNQHPHNRDITLMPQPGGSETRLEAPGDCMVVRANSSGPLSLVVAAEHRDADAEVEIRLEHLPLHKAARSQSFSKVVPAMAKSAALATVEVEVLAHVSRRGDVMANAGEWICGPALPLPIEGIEVRWLNQPAGVELRYSASSARAGQKRHVTTGEFAGTRGKAASLTHLEFSLSGPASAHYELRGEALFLGAAITARRGRKISFSGPSDREPLVGLRLEVVGLTPTSLSKDAAIERQRQPGKVRVYRSAASNSMSIAAVNHL